MSGPAVAGTDVLLKLNASLLAWKGPSGYHSGVEFDQISGHTSLIKPQILQVHFRCHKQGIFLVPFVHAQSNESHFYNY